MSAAVTKPSRTSRTSRPDRPGRRRRVRESPVDRVFLVGVYILLTTFLLVVLLPLWYIVVSSFSSPEAVSAGRVFLWPVDFTLRGYEVVLTNPTILTGFANSFFYTIAGTAISVTLTVMLAYPLSRADFVGRKVLTAAVVFTMLFAGGLIPTYLVVQNLGMLDTRWALLIPKAVAVWPAILAITYFRTAIPDELREAGEIDGASDLRILWKVVLPLSAPMLAVIALMYAIVQWNSYFDALIYLRDDSLYPLQLVLRNILILNTDAGADVTAAIERQQLASLLKYSLIVVSTVPMMLIYPFVARYFTRGLLLGAVKG
ncbi:carbohydrate ABC transporter permease [Ruania suaedae]|uniref:carbohydrate ABC transporter permease n=1 Tax=Ruania suaedae TaxID=2897774 RepID=UPI001E4CBA30|nr:carbohydrate ABC transporter permease [Ruania suaedae]UFU02889.1 carbohydrate ABC transporter permease [Ruania suaedae]